MERRISATDLVRSLGDVLGRVRFRNDAFVIERNGEPVARLVPMPEASATSAAEAMQAWRDVGEPEAAFADDLETVGSLDEPAADPWVS